MADLLAELKLTEACTLPTAERPLRFAEFDALFVNHLLSIEDQEGRAQFMLTGERGLGERVGDLAGRETALLFVLHLRS